MRRRVLGLIVLIAAALFAARYMADGGGSRSDAVSPLAPVVVALRAAADLAAPGDEPRVSALESVALPDSAQEQGPVAAMSGPSARLHGRVLPASGRDALSGDIAVAATDVFGEKKRALCDADGAYALESLEPGRYWLQVGSMANGGGRTVVDVRGDTRCDIQLELPCVLEIRVVDELGRPSTDLGLYAAATVEDPGEWIEEARIGWTNPIGCGRFEHANRSSAQADGDVLGRVLVDRNPPLHASLMRYQRVLATQRVEPGTTLVRFVLRSDEPALRTGSIRLRLIDSVTREPLAKANVLADGAATRSVQAVGGTCEIGALLAGTYRLQFMTKDYAMERREVLVRPGEAVDLGDVPLGAGQWVSGRVVDETGQGGQLSVRFDPCEADGRTGPMYGAVYSFPTKPDGTFRISGLAPGFHRLEVMGKRDLAECVAVVDVREGPVENVTLTVVSGVTLIVDPDGKRGPGARFAVLDENGVRVVSRVVTEPEPVRVRLAPGRYTVEFRSSREDDEPRTAAFEIAREPVVVRMR